jgi:hypothetical protein
MTGMEKVYTVGSIAIGIGTYFVIKALDFSDVVGIIGGLIAFAIPVFVIGVPRGARILGGIFGMFTGSFGDLFKQKS